MWQVCIYVVLVKGKKHNIESSDQVTNECKVEGLNKQTKNSAIQMRKRQSRISWSSCDELLSCTKSIQSMSHANKATLMEYVGTNPRQEHMLKGELNRSLASSVNH